MSRREPKRKPGFLLSLAAIIALGALTTSAIFTALLVRYRTKDLVDLEDARLLTSAELELEILGADYHDRIVGPDSVSPDEFRRIVARNDDLCRRLNLQYLWSVLRVDGRFVFTSATHSDLSDPRSPCASFFETHRDPDAFTPAMQSGRKPTFSSFRNEWGAGRMVLIPRKDALGRTYIVGASLQLSRLDAMIRRTILTSSGIGLLIVCGGFLFALLLARSFTTPVARLTEATRRLASGDFDVELEPARTRELDSLSSSIHQMRDGLRRQVSELRASEEKHRRLFETMAQGVIYQSAEGPIVSANPAAERILGLTLSQMMGRTSTDPGWKAIREDGSELRGEDHPSMVALRTGKPYGPSIMGVYHPKKNAHVWISVTATPLFAQGQTRPFQVYTTFDDITERKRAEEKLKHSHDLMRYIIEHANAAVAVHDRDLRYIYVSQRYLAQYKAKERDVIGKHHYEVFPDLPQEWRDVHQRALRGEVLSADRDPYHRADGTVDWTRWECRPWYEAEGVIGGIIVYTEVITERVREEEEKDKLQAQLLQAQKMESVGRLAGGVAHDFNNMLSAILGQAELAMTKCLPSDPVHSHLDAIETSARRSAGLVRQLLAFARRQTVAPRVLDLNETVGGMLKMLQRLIGEDLDFAWKPAAGLWPVKIDPSQIDQLLANLCVNARDAIAGVGRITIETANVARREDDRAVHPELPCGDYVTLSVSDDGCGMDERVLDHLFEPFFTTKEVGKGTGLGLATVYGIVKQNDGFIDVESEPGKGSTFTIYLPGCVGEAVEARPESPEGMPKGGGETVLLVEDERVVLDLGKEMLERLGYSVLAADTPREAIRLARKHAGEISLLVTDMVMPEMNGRDLAEAMSKERPAMKCLFTSGHTAEVIASGGVLEEGVHFLQKPFSMRDLAVKVREALESDPPCRSGSRPTASR